jgi:hypothetical protein
VQEAPGISRGQFARLGGIDDVVRNCGNLRGALSRRTKSIKGTNNGHAISRLFELFEIG